MAYLKYNKRTVWAESGAIAPGATVTFFHRPSGAPAEVYADSEGLQPLGNSVVSNERGEIGAYIPGGIYRIRIEKNGDLLEEITDEPVMGEAATMDGNEFIKRASELANPSELSFVQSDAGGFAYFRSIDQTRTDLKIDDRDVTLTAPTVAALKSSTGVALIGGRNLLSTELAALASATATIRTASYAVQGIGGAQYLIKTLAAHRAHLGVPGWVPDGKIDHYLMGGTTYVAVLLVGAYPVLMPEWAGAVGDGVNQDHAAIQACLNYLENRKLWGTVWLSRHYLIGDTIWGRSYASIAGSGRLTAANGLNKTVLDIYAENGVRKIWNVSYAGFTIDGNKAGQTTTDNLLGSCFSLRCQRINPGTNTDTVNHTGELENISIDNLTCVNGKMCGFNFGLLTFVERGYHFGGLTASGCINGILVNDYCEYITFTGIQVQKNTYGVRDLGASNINFIGGITANNAGAGIYFETSGRNTSKKIVDGLQINHNLRGVWIGNGIGTVGKPIDHVTIINCHLLANNWQGVVGTGGVDINIVHNTFSGNGWANTGNIDDIYLTAACKRWRIDNKHIDSTGDTRNAVRYLMPAPAGVDSHPYHRIDGTFEGYDPPIAYEPFGNPATTPINANTCFVQGVFEYWNTAGYPPSGAAGDANANVHINKIPLGTICVNNADPAGAERWIAVKAASSGSTSLGVSFYRLS